MKRPFSVWYDPLTQTIVKLDRVDRFDACVEQLSAHMNTLRDGMERLKALRMPC